MEAWKLDSNIPCDEQTQGFQGNHADKQRITYKSEGVASNAMLSAKMLDDQYYRCGLDNLYMSAKFAELALKCK
eukprot:11519840-Ditylum_brightwellii.AAC.1